MRSDDARDNVQPVSRGSLEALEKVSPAASMTSLQRYLAMPASEEALPVEIIDAVTSCTDGTTTEQTPSDISAHILAFRAKVAQLPSQGASYTRPTRSVAGSEGSGGSTQSRASQRSFRSVDSRGSRRGRKLWVRSERQESASSSIVSKSHERQGRFFADLSGDHQSANVQAQEKISSRIYCTWPSCETSFTFPFEWRRHEEAKHYQPYIYVCCLESTFDTPIDRCFVCKQANVTVKHMVATHMRSCMKKSHADRSFFRKDQLVQHIKGVHAVGERPGRQIQNLPSLWKVANLSNRDVTLKCGFCGNSFQTWEDRQAHVLEHLQAGICKASWWPERLPMPTETTETRLKTENDTVTCTNCDFICNSDFLVHQDKHQCTVWSCTFLHDHHALYATWPSNAGNTTLTAACKLCDFFTSNVDKWVLEAHAQVHRYRSCNQEWFTNERDFAMHLISEHGAVEGSEFEMSLQMWTSRQWLRGDISGANVVSTRGARQSNLCDGYSQQGRGDQSVQGITGSYSVYDCIYEPS